MSLRPLVQDEVHAGASARNPETNAAADPPLPHATRLCLQPPLFRGIAAALLVCSAVTAYTWLHRPIGAEPAAAVFTRKAVTAPSFAVVLLGDMGRGMGMAATINSIRQQPAMNATPIYVGLDGDAQAFEALLPCLGVPTEGVHVRDIRPWADALNTATQRVRVDSSMNYLRANSNSARFLMPRIFPELVSSLVWYLDGDCIVAGDLKPAAVTLRQSGRAIAAAWRDRRMAELMKPALLPLYRKRYGQEFDMRAVAWNGGVFVADLAQWQAMTVEEEAAAWSALHAKHNLWSLNTQPLMHVIFPPDKVMLLGPEWNVDGIGYKGARDLPDANLTSAKVLHWSGQPHLKPWSQGKPVRGQGRWDKALPLWKSKGKECMARARSGGQGPA